MHWLGYRLHFGHVLPGAGRLDVGAAADRCGGQHPARQVADADRATAVDAAQARPLVAAAVNVDLDQAAAGDPQEAAAGDVGPRRHRQHLADVDQVALAEVGDAVHLRRVGQRRRAQHEDVLAAAAGEAVGPAFALKHVGAIVADDLLGEVVAGQVLRALALVVTGAQHLDLAAGRQDVTDAGPDGVDADAASALQHDRRRAADAVGL